MKRVRQKDIAEALGVHVSTVSKALKGDPSVSRETVSRVRKVAETLGFAPDPMLSALAAYRKQLKPEVYHANIAWVYNHSREDSMEHFSGFEDYFSGATARAAELGYRLDPFWMEKPGQSLERILQARGIRSVIVAPQAVPGRPLSLTWERYAAVAIGYSLEKPQLDRVTNDHFATMTELLEILNARGYQRVGCYIWEVDNERMGRRAQSAFLSVSRDSRSPVTLYSQFDAASFLRWVQQHELDAVVCRGKEQLKALATAGIAVPESIGVAGYALDANETFISGMHHNNLRIGAASVEWVSGKLQRAQFEVPDYPQRLLIPSSWLENGSLKGGSPVHSQNNLSRNRGT